MQAAAEIAFSGLPGVQDTLPRQWTRKTTRQNKSPAYYCVLDDPSASCRIMLVYDSYSCRQDGSKQSAASTASSSPPIIADTPPIKTINNKRTSRSAPQTRVCGCNFACRGTFSCLLKSHRSSPYCSLSVCFPLSLLSARPLPPPSPPFLGTFETDLPMGM